MTLNRPTLCIRGIVNICLVCYWSAVSVFGVTRVKYMFNDNGRQNLITDTKQLKNISKKQQITEWKNWMDVRVCFVTTSRIVDATKFLLEELMGRLITSSSETKSISGSSSSSWCWGTRGSSLVTATPPPPPIPRPPPPPLLMVVMTWPGVMNSTLGVGEEGVSPGGLPGSVVLVVVVVVAVRRGVLGPTDEMEPSSSLMSSSRGRLDSANDTSKEYYRMQRCTCTNKHTM